MKQDILCILGKHDWEVIDTICEPTRDLGKVRICKNCMKSQKCKEKRDNYTEWR